MITNLTNRLSISEIGCNVLLDHNCSDDIITMLIQALGTDEAGLAMCRKERGRV